MEQNHQVGKGSTSRSARRDVEARKGRPRRPRLESLESRELLSVNEYSLLPAENNNTNSEPTAIVAGPDGNLWFTDLGTSEVGKVTPAGQITMYTTGLTANSSPEGITTGPDGNLWFVETAANKIGRINPSTGQITEFTQGLSSGAEPVGITSGPDGNLWFTEFGTDKIGRINPSTGAITEYSTGISKNAEPEEITVGPDGNLWFTEQGTASIGRINPTTGVVTEFSKGITAGSFPTGIAAGSDGNIWFTEYYDQKIGMLNPTTGAVTEYPISTPAETGFDLVDITTGSDGNLWLTAPAQNAGAILSFNPTTHAVTAYDTTTDAGPYGIAYGPDGNVWFTEVAYTFVSGGQTEGGGAVGDVTLATHLSLVVQTQPTSIAPGADFGLTVDIDDAGATDANFNGAVTINLANNPGGSTLGGTTTVTAVNGVATFSNLTLNNPGNDYTLEVSSNALTPTPTAGINVTSGSSPSPTSPSPTSPSPTSPSPTSPSPTSPSPTSPSPTSPSPTSPSPTSPSPTSPSPTSPSPTSPPPTTPTSTPTPTLPQLVAEQISTAYLKHNKKGKPIGKPVVEIVLTFSAAMNPGTISNPGAYQVAWASTKKIKKQVQTVYHPVAVLSATVDPTNTMVTLVTSTMKTKFAKGGQVLIVSPASLLGSDGEPLGGITKFAISPRAGGISPT